jgi:hypothetical protein
MSSNENRPSLHGHAVVDTNMEPVGKITDVIFDNRDLSPRFAIVKTGMLGGERFMPLENSYLDADGRLIVPFDKMAIKGAPKVRGEHVLSPEIEREVCEYYGVAA